MEKEQACGKFLYLNGLKTGKLKKSLKKEEASRCRDTLLEDTDNKIIREKS
jgi:hypothetical protein